MVRNHALAGKLLCLTNENGVIVAFMGIRNNKLEMLFILPAERGKGLGKFLLEYAIGKLAAVLWYIKKGGSKRKNF